MPAIQKHQSNHRKEVTHVNNQLFSVTTADVLKALSLRTDVSKLSPEEIDLAYQEVKAILDTELDIRPYLDMALDVWLITRKL
jgi:hypothetical protein